MFLDSTYKQYYTIFVFLFLTYCREQAYGYQGGKAGEWDELGDWDWHIYTTKYKIDN